jgi:hypothetical protein
MFPLLLPFLTGKVHCFGEAKHTRPRSTLARIGRFHRYPPGIEAAPITTKISDTRFRTSSSVSAVASFF